MSGPLSQAASVTNNHLSYPLKFSFSRFLKPLAPQTIISQAPLSLEFLSDFTSFIGFPCSEPSFFTPSQFLSPKLPQAPGPSSHPVHDHRTETGATGWPLAALQIQRRSWVALHIPSSVLLFVFVLVRIPSSARQRQRQRQWQRHADARFNCWEQYNL